MLRFKICTVLTSEAAAILGDDGVDAAQPSTAERAKISKAALIRLVTASTTATD